MFDNFVKKWNGVRGVPNPTNPNNEALKGQCVSGAREYMDDVLNIPLDGIYGDAKDYWYKRNQAPLNKYFDAIDYYPDMKFKKGDIFVLAPTSDNPYGHIGMCFGDSTSTQMHIFDSNYKNQKTFLDRSRGFDGLFGVLRPKDFLQSKIGTDEPIKPVKFGPLNTSLKITKVTTNKGYPIRTEPMGKETVYWAKEGDYLVFDGADPVSTTFLADSYKWARVRTYGGDVGYIQLDFDYMRVEV